MLSQSVALHSSFQAVLCLQDGLYNNPWNISKNFRYLFGKWATLDRARKSYHAHCSERYENLSAGEVVLLGSIFVEFGSGIDRVYARRLLQKINRRGQVAYILSDKYVKNVLALLRDLIGVTHISGGEIVSISESAIALEERHRYFEASMLMRLLAHKLKIVDLQGSKWAVCQDCAMEWLRRCDVPVCLEKVS